MGGRVNLIRAMSGRVAGRAAMTAASSFAADIELRASRTANSFLVAVTRTASMLKQEVRAERSRMMLRISHIL